MSPPLPGGAKARSPPDHLADHSVHQGRTGRSRHSAQPHSTGLRRSSAGAVSKPGSLTGPGRRYLWRIARPRQPAGGETGLRCALELRFCISLVPLALFLTLIRLHLLATRRSNRSTGRRRWRTRLQPAGANALPSTRPRRASLSTRRRSPTSKSALLRAEFARRPPVWRRTCPRQSCNCFCSP